MEIFGFLGGPLGFILGLVYDLVKNYFVAIFLFTFLIRLLLFPLSLKTQKSQADRARLAPRLERLQKKYAKDPKKLQEKQMALYEKHGVSMTGGCLPMIVQMVVLFGIISAIYSPITHLTSVPEEVVNASVTAMTGEGELNKKDFAEGNYYRELRVLQNIDSYKDDVIEEISKLEGYDTKKAETYYNELVEFEKDFQLGNMNMLEQPWKGTLLPNILWLIPLISGITAMLSSLLSMHYQKQLNSAQQQGQGCTNVMMLGMMPAMSLFIAFSVPGAVGLYWISSNLIALLQTFILNLIYNPAKIRAQAEIEYEERRRQKQEDKKRLAEARAREQRELAQQLKEENQGGQKKKAKSAPKKEPAPKEEAPAEEAPAVTEEEKTEE